MRSPASGSNSGPCRSRAILKPRASMSGTPYISSPKSIQAGSAGDANRRSPAGGPKYSTSCRVGDDPILKQRRERASAATGRTRTRTCRRRSSRLFAWSRRRASPPPVAVVSPRRGDTRTPCRSASRTTVATARRAISTPLPRLVRPQAPGERADRSRFAATATRAPRATAARARSPTRASVASVDRRERIPIARHPQDAGLAKQRRVASVRAGFPEPERLQRPARVDFLARRSPCESTGSRRRSSRGCCPDRRRRAA